MMDMTASPLRAAVDLFFQVWDDVNYSGREKIIAVEMLRTAYQKSLKTTKKKRARG